MKTGDFYHDHEHLMVVDLTEEYNNAHLIGSKLTKEIYPKKDNFKTQIGRLDKEITPIEALDYLTIPLPNWVIPYFRIYK